MAAAAATMGATPGFGSMREGTRSVLLHRAYLDVCVGELINRRRRRRLRFDDTNDDDDSNHPRSRRYNCVYCDFSHELAITSCSSDVYV